MPRPKKSTKTHRQSLTMHPKCWSTEVSGILIMKYEKNTHSRACMKWQYTLKQKKRMEETAGEDGGNRCRDDLQSPTIETQRSYVTEKDLCSTCSHSGTPENAEYSKPQDLQSGRKHLPTMWAWFIALRGHRRIGWRKSARNSDQDLRKTTYNRVCMKKQYT